MNKAYEDFIYALKRNGVQLISFTTPCCEKLIETLPSCTNEPWKPLVCCPHCNSIFRKVVTKTDAVGIPLAEESFNEI